MSTSYIGFSDEEKIKAFDRLSVCFYDRNFGTMAKSDFETLLFDIYIEHLLDTNQKIDDYTMSKLLGIAQSRIRTLKVRKELRYPRNGFQWENAFAECTKNAVFDEQSRRIQFIIEDVNVQTELRYFVESKGWYDEYHLNPRLFSCRADFFVKLCMELSQNLGLLEENNRKALMELSEKYTKQEDKNALSNILNGALEDGLKGLMINGTKTLIVEVLKLLPFGGITATIFNYIADVIERS